MATLRMFANLRESAGTTAEEFAGNTVGEIIAAAVAAYGPEFERGLPAAKTWVNGEPAGPTTAVTSGDEVALIPPVSGGAATAGEARADVVQAGLVAALVLALAVGNIISAEVFAFVTVGAAIAWLWDVGDALAVRSSRVQIIPVMIAAGAGANGAYGWGSEGLAGGLVVGVMVILTWAVLDRRARSIEALANAALLGIAAGMATGALVIVHLRNEDEVTLFLVLATLTSLAGWAAGRFAPATSGLDANVAGLLAALVVGVVAAFASDVLTLPVMILVAVGIGAGFIAGRALGSLARRGEVVHTVRAPGLLTVLDGPVVAAGLFWVVVVVFA